MKFLFKNGMYLGLLKNCSSSSLHAAEPQPLAEKNSMSTGLPSFSAFISDSSKEPLNQLMFCEKTAEDSRKRRITVKNIIFFMIHLSFYVF
jgi:hypothetical protein